VFEKSVFEFPVSAVFGGAPHRHAGLSPQTVAINPRPADGTIRDSPETDEAPAGARAPP